MPAELVVRAIGHRGTELPGLPFDDEAGRVPHEAGRVTGAPVGTYVVGWAKRGPSGGIGANRVGRRGDRGSPCWPTPPPASSAAPPAPSRR